ncbi:MAG: cation diffusion facilitator family transporter, partial [Verrucomicrobiota bacterium]
TVINAFTAWLFMKGGQDDLNMRGAFLHMASDAAVSVGVMLSGLLVILFQWYWTDPLISLVIGVTLLFATWNLLKESVLASLDAAPASVDLDAIRAYLNGLGDVADMHDLHVWSLGTRETALSCHLVMPGERPTDRRLAEISTHLRETFKVGHVTLQTETGDPDIIPALCNPQCDPPQKDGD